MPETTYSQDELNEAKETGDGEGYSRGHDEAYEDVKGRLIDEDLISQLESKMAEYQGLFDNHPAHPEVRKEVRDLIEKVLTVVIEGPIVIP